MPKPLTVFVMSVLNKRFPKRSCTCSFDFYKNNGFWAFIKKSKSLLIPCCIIKITYAIYNRKHIGEYYYLFTHFMIFD